MIPKKKKQRTHKLRTCDGPIVIIVGKIIILNHLPLYDEELNEQRRADKNQRNVQGFF